MEYITSSLASVSLSALSWLGDDSSFQLLKAQKLEWKTDVSGSSPVLWQVFSQKGVCVTVDDAVQESLPGALTASIKDFPFSSILATYEAE